MNKPYRLKKRNPQGIWYYKLEAEKTFHTTGESVKAKAERFVLDVLRTAEEQQQQKTQYLQEITLKAFCKNFFVWGKCPWIKRRHERGMAFEKHIAQMRLGHLKNHILPVLGNRTLRSLRIVDFDSFFDTLELSNQTKNHILSTLSILMKEAQRQELIDRNPLECFEPFVNNHKKRDILTETEERTLFPSSPEEAVTIWGSVQYAAFFSLLYTTGARCGEIGALTWEDITKATDGTFLINKTLKIDRTTGKTKTGVTVYVPFIEPCVSLIAALKEQYEPKKETELIFQNTKGLPIDRGVLMAVWKRVLNNNQIPLEGRNLVIHSLRHGFNTKVKDKLGGDIVRLMTGHTSEKMTARYDHPDEEKERRKVSQHVKNIESFIYDKS
jgi:integrase